MLMKCCLHQECLYHKPIALGGLTDNNPNDLRSDEDAGHENASALPIHLSLLISVRAWQTIKLKCFGAP